jgi:hypothetical protein
MTKKLKFITTLPIVLALLIVQVGSVFAEPALQEGFITGIITALECSTDLENPTIIVTIDVEDELQTMEIDLATAVVLGLIAPDTECSAEALADAIGTEVSIDPSTILPANEDSPHPIGAALSLFFSDITDYETIMSAHEDGTGFGVLAQALWLTMNMEGDSETLLAIIQAKKNKDFSAFVLEDGSTPQNWGQFKKAVLNDNKKANLGVVMSDNDMDDKTNNGNGQNKEKTNNGKGHDKKKAK